MRRGFITLMAVIAVGASALAGCGDSHGGSTGTGDDATHMTSTGDSDHGGTTTAATDGHDMTADAHLTVAVAGGVATGDTEATVGLGDVVMIHVTSDVDDTVHVHGYDREFPVTAGTEASITFTADIAGRFEVELHASELRVMELTVQ